MIEPRPSTERQRVAAFDVDGTLTHRDCVVPFLRSVAGSATLSRRLAMHPVSIASMLGRRDRDGLKAAAAAATFTGRAFSDVEQLAESFAADVFANGLREDRVQLLNAHREQGDTIVLVSASFEVYLRPLAHRLDVDDVIAARLEVGADGRLTGRLDGANCRGPEKVARLHEWLDEHTGGRGSVHLTAYGDSTGDREMLADADVAHWFGRRAMPR